VNIEPDANTAGQHTSVLIPTRPLGLTQEGAAATGIIGRAPGLQTDILSLVNFPVPANKEWV